MPVVNSKPAAKSKTKGKAPKSPPPAEASREIVYPELTMSIAAGENGLQDTQAKDLLGWEEEGEENKFGSDFLLRDRSGAKIRCSHNTTNRFLYMSNVEALVQEMLNRRWRMNGEPIIIGQYADILNGQHQLIALVLAEQDRTGPQKYHWEEKWQGPITIDKVVVYGVEEDDKIINTMDTCKPRSLEDVIFRSKFRVFASCTPQEQRTAAKICAAAIKILWHRIGLKADPYAPVKTHSEALDFLARHTKLLTVVSHIMEEDQRGDRDEGGPLPLSQFVPRGYAAAFCYLMAASDSDGDEYRNATVPDERVINYGSLEKAMDFWVLLGKQSGSLMEVRHAIRALDHPELSLGGSMSEKAAVLVRGWLAFKAHGHVTQADVRLDYHEKDDIRQLVDDLTFGGIDQGWSKRQKQEEDGEAVREEDIPVPEDISLNAKKVQAPGGKVRSATAGTENPAPHHERPKKVKRK
jgi:hypothetical protein